jgi:D-tyrosyl-tRNA(Tyr) deacylase
MRVIVQRVTEASVTTENQLHAQIKQGLLLLIGIEENDVLEDCIWTAAKIANMRIFGDEKGMMNKNVTEINGEVMVISQFTLYASTKKGSRPSFLKAAKPEYATKIYEIFCLQIQQELSRKIKTGIFGADMKIALVNDGPVTIFIDSKNRE